MQLVPTYLRAVLKQAANIMLVKDVVNHGAGHAGRNTVVSIMILPQVKNYLQQKIAIMRHVVKEKRISKKRNIVVVVIRVIARRDGNNGETRN
jgi:hypothetical protein